MSQPDTNPLDDVRSELQRKGYLTHSVERYLLQDALRPVQSRRTIGRLAVKLGGLGGVAMALISTLLLSHWNELLQRDPFDVLPLFVHLLPLWTIAFAFFFIVLAALMVVLLKRYPALKLSFLSLSLVIGGVGGGLALGLWVGWESAIQAPRWPGWVLALVAASVAYVISLLLYHGLLALAIRLTERTPRDRAGRQQKVLLGLAAATALLSLIPASLMRSTAPLSPEALPVSQPGRVLVVGMDGVLGSEFDYLLSRGDMPTLSSLVDRGGVVASYDRPDLEPAAVWTTVATGLSSPLHGVAAVDSFRPLGLRSSLAVSGPFRWYFEKVEEPLGLVEHRPVLANRRSALTFWELAARGGTPVLAVNWWSTFPAENLSGTVIAHGAYQLLQEGVAGAVSSEEAQARIKRHLPSEEDQPSVGIVRSALAEGADVLIQRALAPEDFYRRAFLSELTTGTQAAALYLPAIDLTAFDWPGDGVPLADLVRSEISAADQLLAEALEVGVWDTVLFVADPARRASTTSGRTVLWRRQGCQGETSLSWTLEMAAAGLMRTLGLPQSRELPEPTSVCDWPVASTEVETFGRRNTGNSVAGAEDEYLENLRALGYL